MGPSCLSLPLPSRLAFTLRQSRLSSEERRAALSTRSSVSHQKGGRGGSRTSWGARSPRELLVSAVVPHARPRRLEIHTRMHTHLISHGIYNVGASGEAKLPHI